MATPRGEYLAPLKNQGGMKPKDFHPLLFRLYTIDKHGAVKVRRLTGKAVVRWKTKRKNEWSKRQIKAEESGETADVEQMGEEE